MKTGFWVPGFVACGALVSGCAMVVLAPGAEQVKLTSAPADVAGCKPVGNVAGTTNQVD